MVASFELIQSSPKLSFKIAKCPVEMPNSGFYQNGEIIICGNRAQTKEEIETEIGHQLIIAYDVCLALSVGFVCSNLIVVSKNLVRKINTEESCSTLVCSELRASNLIDCASSTFKNRCIKKQVLDRLQVSLIAGVDYGV